MMYVPLQTVAYITLLGWNNDIKQVRTSPLRSLGTTAPVLLSCCRQPPCTYPKQTLTIPRCYTQCLRFGCRFMALMGYMTEV